MYVVNLWQKIHCKWRLWVASKTSGDVHAWWISPEGVIYEVRTTHIEFTSAHAENFGWTFNRILKVFKKYKETFPIEGKARDEIFRNIYSKNWIRIRYDHSVEYMIALNALTESKAGFIKDWALSLLMVNGAWNVPKGKRAVGLNDMDKILDEGFTLRGIAEGVLQDKYIQKKESRGN